MYDNQITALAREYADADGYGLQIVQDDTEMFLRWLSRRYSLVEKESQPRWISPKDAFPEIRERVLICEKVANQHKVFIDKRVPSPCTDGWEWNQSAKESVVAWMPLPKYTTEIAKEVEE